MKLVIFDLDQTLVDLLSVHDKATEQVFEDFFQIKAKLTEVDFAGRSLNDSLIELARLKNIPEDKISEKHHALLEYYEKGFIQNFPNNPSAYILPGVKELLQHLSETEHVIALYTGVSQGIAEKVLTATSLKKYFTFRFYGTEAEIRADMVMLAIERAEKLTGVKFGGKDIVIIGDSLRDIECGRLFHALTIAVATGFTSEEQLMHQQPDYLFRNMKDTQKVLEAIG